MKRETIRKKRLSDIPVFWQLLIIMLLVLSTVFIQQIISNRMYEKKLIRDYIQIETKHLEQSSDALFSQIYNVYAIPRAIEDTAGFRYIRAFSGNELPAKYSSVLSMLQSAFRNQIYLRQNSCDGMIYLSRLNVICTNSKVFFHSEDCLGSYLLFEKTDSEEIVSYLEQRGSVKVLPMQNVTTVSKVGDATSKRVLTVIFHPSDTRIAVLLMYTEEFILRSLGINDSMPRGTEITIVSNDETAIMDYTIGDSDTIPDNQMVEITAYNSTMHYTVAMRIPKSYFTSELKKSVANNYFIFVLAVFLSVCLCIVFAKRQTKPITDMVQNYEINCGDGKQNELHRLDHILSYTKKEHSRIERMLFLNMLSRAFSGNVLSDSEEKEFANYLSADVSQFRVCVLSVHEDFSVTLGEFIEGWKRTPGVYATPISMDTWGILLLETGNELEPLQEFMKQNSKRADIRCGISGRIASVDGFHIALRQAYMSYPSSTGCGIFSGENAEKVGMDWRQHEQFYHALLTNDKEKTFQILKVIQKASNTAENVKGMFSVLSFTIDSAAREFGVTLPVEKGRMKYNPAQTPQANIQQLFETVEALFDQTNKQNRHVCNIQQDQVFKYVEDNYADGNLCAASVAERLGISEKKVYSITRQTLDLSFNEYLLSLRMRHAAALLCQTDLSVDQVAEKCGYQASSTFYRIFKKYFNETPTQYRARKCAPPDGEE